MQSIKKYLLLLCGFLSVVFIGVSCSENLDDENIEYTNWVARNNAAFLKVSTQARKAIEAAKKEYGDQWSQHCNYRMYSSYQIPSGAPATIDDSICVEIMKRGEGNVTPMYTDSVTVNYRGFLIPTTSFPKGQVFDHSGLLIDSASIFNPQTAAPIGFYVNSLVPGFSTVLQYMRPKSMWRVYIPSKLAYGDKSMLKIPAHSMLIFDLQLVNFTRKH